MWSLINVSSNLHTTDVKLTESFAFHTRTMYPIKRCTTESNKPSGPMKIS